MLFVVCEVSDSLKKKERDNIGEKERMLAKVCLSLFGTLCTQIDLLPLPAQLILKSHEARHKGDVRTSVWPPLADVLVGALHRPPLGPHEPADDDAYGPRLARAAVDVHWGRRAVGFIEEATASFDVRLDVWCLDVVYHG